MTNHYAELTDTTSQTVFPVARPNGSHVTFAFDTDVTRPGLTKITLPSGSTWTPGPHWHEQHTEYFRVLQGRVNVILDGVSKTVTANDGPQVVDRFVVHEFMRADRGAEHPDAGDVVVEEWTDPADGRKQLFFRNLLGVLGDSRRYWRGWTTMQIVLTRSEFDDYDLIVPPSTPKWISYAVTHLMYRSIRVASWFVGLRPWYEPYTPEKSRSVVASRR